MKRRLSVEQEAALAALRDRLVLTLSFFENAQDFPTGKQLRDLVESTAARGSLRDMRLLAREIDGMTIALAPHERDGLEALLQQRLGVDAEAERAELRRKMAVVLQRGTIASEKERRRMEEYADLLEATSGDPAEIAAVRRLLQYG
jgi:hypothetical protein